MDMVRIVRKAAGGNKTGHAGTLDPLATGLVICCLGRATRSVEKLMGLTKVYLAMVDLSAFSTTDDLEGEREDIAVDQPPGRDRIQQVCREMTGVIDQVPPPYSAVHVNGRRAYKLAREGKTPQLTPRKVRIDQIRIIGYHYPHLQLQITCGRGTYIRSIARDIGGKLGTGGHLASLRRTAIGHYHVDQAHTIEHLPIPLTENDLLPVSSE